MSTLTDAINGIIRYLTARKLYVVPPDIGDTTSPAAQLTGMERIFGPLTEVTPLGEPVEINPLAETDEIKLPDNAEELEQPAGQGPAEEPQEQAAPDNSQAVAAITERVNELLARERALSELDLPSEIREIEDIEPPPLEGIGEADGEESLDEAPATADSGTEVKARELEGRVAILEMQGAVQDYTPELLDQGVILLGKPTEAYSSGATMTLDPCDSAGTDNGDANVVVQAGWTMPPVAPDTPTTIPVTAIVPYQQAADELFYVIGAPREVITNMQYDTTSHKLQKKIRYDFGIFTGTESGWVDVTTSVDCTTGS